MEDQDLIQSQLYRAIEFIQQNHLRIPQRQLIVINSLQQNILSKHKQQKDEQIELYLQKVFELFPNSQPIIKEDCVQKRVIDVQSLVLKVWRKKLILLNMPEKKITIISKNMLTNTKILQLEKYQVKFTGKVKKRYTIEFISESAENKYKRLIFGHHDEEFMQQLYQYIRQSQTTDFYRMSLKDENVNLASQTIEDMSNMSEMKDTINLYQDIQLKFRCSTQFSFRKFSSISQEQQQLDHQQLQQNQIIKQQNIFMENVPEELQKYNIVKLNKQIYNFDEYSQDKDHQDFNVYINKKHNNIVKIQFECQYDILDLIGIFVDT